MSNQTLEPSCRKDKKSEISISLRGSLAESYSMFTSSSSSSSSSSKAANDFLNLLLASNDEDLIKAYQKGVVVIGWKNELGKFSPDW